VHAPFVKDSVGTDGHISTYQFNSCTIVREEKTSNFYFHHPITQSSYSLCGICTCLKFSCLRGPVKQGQSFINYANK